jgi:WD40 repeat protein
MNPGIEAEPQQGSDGWIVAVHLTKSDMEPIGTGFLIDQHRILTCAHVVCERGVPRRELWVAFPKSERLMGRRIRVAAVRVPDAEKQATDDVAVLELAEDVGVQFAARLRCPNPEQLVGLDWWSFGFANRDLFGNPARGALGSVRAYGWIQLDVQTQDGGVLAEGYSGAPLWSDAYQAVVGIIGQADARNSGRALTLWRARTALPDAGLELLADWSAEAAGESALAAWGWRLADDPEAGRHWRPRARGVTRDSELGFRFRGRRKALLRVAEWIVDEQPQRTALVVTGSPGVGKSAVLGRIVTSADPGIAAQLPPEDDAVRAALNSVSCAVHAKSKSALDVAIEIARAASAPLPQQTADLALGLRAALEERSERKFTVVIDALDEAVSPKDARDIVRWIVRPLVEDLADFGVRVVVGSRRRDNNGDLLDTFKPARTLVDLDDAEYFELEDLQAYALVSLQLLGSERAGNPYADPKAAGPVARRIAELSKQNFLVAGLMARAHGLYDTVRVRPEDISFSPNVDDALNEFLERIPPVGTRTAAELLTALAYAEAPGFTAMLWHVAVAALYGDGPGEERLRSFARASAANFLVEDTAGEGRTGSERVFRLFHQALNDVLLAARDQRVPDEGALTRMLAEHGRDLGWAKAPAYLFRSLPGHAERGRAMDSLLAHAGYPLYADLRRLVLTAMRCYAGQDQEPERLRLLRKTLRTMDDAPSLRASYFSLVEAQEQLGTVYREALADSPYRVPWARTRPQEEQTVLEGHDGPVYQIMAVPTDVPGRYSLVSAGQDGTVRLWDPDFGGGLRVIRAQQGPVRAICAVPWPGGSTLIASAGDDGVIRIWNPDTGENVRTLRPRAHRIDSLVSCEGAQRQQMLAALYEDNTLYVWDLLTGSTVCQFPADERIGEPTAFCPEAEPSSSSDSTLLVSVRKPKFGFVYEWRVRGGSGEDASDAPRMVHHATLPERSRPILRSIPFGRDSRATVVADDVGRLTVWESGSMAYAVKWRSDQPVTAVCAVPMPDGRNLMAVASGDRGLDIWDVQAAARAYTPRPLHTTRAFTGRANAATSITLADGSTQIATAGDDSVIRLWKPLPDSEGFRAAISYGAHHSLCPAGQGPYALLYSMTREGDIHAWVQATGEHVRKWLPATERMAVSALIPRSAGGCLLAVQDLVGALTVADLETERIVWTEGTESRVDRLHEPLACMHFLAASPRSPWLLTAGVNGAIRMWNVLTGESPLPPKRSPSSVLELCSVVGRMGETFAVAGCEDGLVRAWHVGESEPVWTLTGHADPIAGVFSASAPGEKPLLGSISGNSQLRVWDLETGALRFSLERPDRWVTLACSLTVGFGRTLIATAGLDRVVRIWDLDGHLGMEIPVRHELESMASSGNRLFLGLSDGLMAVDVEDTFG